MKITLFKKQGTTKDGRKFDYFVGKLNRKDGTSQYVTVKHSGDRRFDFDPNKAPYIIEVDKADANLQAKTWTDRDGNERKDYTLWVKNYRVSDEKYVDHSLDDFE